MSKIGTDIAYAKALLEAGKLVAIPTETVYGLAGNGLNEQAVAAIFAAKNRPSFDPMILHTHSLSAIAPLVKTIPPAIRQLADAFMPGPLSILLEKTALVPDIVTAGSPLVAIRIPNHPLSLQLLSQLDFPLAAPSANPFGYISPTTAHHVADQLGDQVDYILDGGACQVGLESTIVKWEKEAGLTVLRVGGIPVEAIESVIGKVAVRNHSSSNPAAPGMLKSHYAPRVPIMLLEQGHPLPSQVYEGKKVGALAFAKYYEELPPDHQLLLSASGDLAEAAQRLFAHLRQLDQMDLDLIVTSYVPNEGLGRAINDKLKRAAARG
ncbi:MAG: L-threonylcarbamoyladenylate synthase [Bacteroidota bacterium]